VARFGFLLKRQFVAACPARPSCWETERLAEALVSAPLTALSKPQSSSNARFARLVTQIGGHLLLRARSHHHCDERSESSRTMSKGPRRQQRRILEKLCREALSPVKGIDSDSSKRETVSSRLCQSTACESSEKPLLATFSLLLPLCCP